LSPFTVSDEWLKKIASEMPLTPRKMREKLMNNYGLSKYDAGVLSDEKEVARFFETVCQETTHNKQAANWLIGPIKAVLNERDSDNLKMPLTARQLADLVNAIADNKINASVANKQVFPFLMDHPRKNVNEAIKELDLSHVSSDDLSDVILKILDRHPDKVKAYQNGKKNLMGMFMGEVMKQTQGAADPKKTNELLRQALEEKN
jgi:Asp-tRNAAsn/Glu-tRNAGln amidotransferase B subunit (PET112 homolog)